MSKETRETKLFLCFMIFALTVCAIGLTMTANPPMSDIYGGGRYTTDVYAVCQALSGHTSSHDADLQTCLSERAEPNMAILMPHILKILFIGFIAITAVLLLVHDKKAEALA